MQAGLEDVWCIVECLANLCGRDSCWPPQDDIFIGLYDGHRGIECAEFARDHLHYYLGSAESYLTNVPKVLPWTTPSSLSGLPLRPCPLFGLTLRTACGCLWPDSVN